MNRIPLLKKRFDELADLLGQVEATKRYENGGLIKGDFVDSEMFLTWRVKVKSLLGTACGRTSEHYIHFKENEKAVIGSTNYSIMKRLKAVFMAAKEDFEGGYLDQPNLEPDEWIEAASALALLGMDYHFGPRTICKRAHAGLIKARAERFRRDQKVVQDNFDIPPEFWWAQGEAALKQNWTTGDFDTWIDHRIHLEAFGVTFRRSDIERARPTPSPSPLTKEKGNKMTTGKHIFIGHGHSLVWLSLEKFLKERLHLSVDEFERVPTAGVATVTRLQEMLGNAGFAFLVLTAEDEQTDSKMHARLNVVHELGLFQGRLGFEKAIILLEDGCEEFSNIQGLGQYRFPAGKIASLFEKISAVLEREGLIQPR